MTRAAPARSISIVIPVLQEQARINALIGRIRLLAFSGQREIIVVDGDPGGSTISTIADRNVIVALSPRGRARQMNTGAALASGDIVLFLHADTDLPADALGRISSVMNDDRCAAGAFDLGIDSRRTIFRITEQYVALRTRLTRVPFGDQAIFIRKDRFIELGGYEDIPIMEDVDLMKRLRRAGHSCCIIPEKVMTSPRRWEQEGIARCTVRNWMLQAAYGLGVSPQRLARWYR